MKEYIKQLEQRVTELEWALQKLKDENHYLEAKLNELRRRK